MTRSALLACLLLFPRLLLANDIATLDALAGQALRDDPQAESQLHDHVVSLRQQAPTPALRAALQALAHFPVIAWQPYSHRGVVRREPVAPVAAAARATLMHWDRATAGKARPGATLAEWEARLAATPAEQRLALLRPLLADPELAGWALLKLSAPELPAAQTEPLLRAALSDERQGAAAAVALARGALPAATFESWLTGPDPRLVRRALLALAMRDDEAARAALRRYAHDEDTPAHLRREVSGWLE